ncbi:hypothetical protein OESDEN_24096 [Oesophagostomum dentatum]|uniref:Uncharacterized protein n=1 Tax=Oesophagostomum dentatum TaxID=61180 RepID=A0A0B1RUA5_OESDE|nr:hypothetical protein OESDEN_24096 [Oesophagostomum dentatum]
MIDLNRKGDCDRRCKARCYPGWDVKRKTISEGANILAQMEMMFRESKAGYKIGKIPITFGDRFFRESKLGSQEIIGYAKGLLYLFFCVN